MFKKRHRRLIDDAQTRSAGYHHRLVLYPPLFIFWGFFFMKSSYFLSSFHTRKHRLPCTHPPRWNRLRLIRTRGKFKSQMSSVRDDSRFPGLICLLFTCYPLRHVAVRTESRLLCGAVIHRTRRRYFLLLQNAGHSHRRLQVARCASQPQGDFTSRSRE